MVRAFKATETVSVGGEDYTLAIDIEIVDEIEDDFDLDFESAAKLVAKGRLGKTARFLRGLLLRHHPDITLDEAYALAREHGNAMGSAMERLLIKAAPEVAEEEKGGNPPIARRGTGGNSSSRGAPPISRRNSSGSKRLALSS